MVRILRTILHLPIAHIVSIVTPYFDRVVLLRQSGSKPSRLYELLQAEGCSEIQFQEEAKDNSNSKTLFVVNGLFNCSVKIQETLDLWKNSINPKSRLFVVVYNSYFSTFFKWGHSLFQIDTPSPTTFITRSGLQDLAEFSGYDIVKEYSLGFGLAWIPYIGNSIERFLGSLPIIRNLALFSLFIFRPKPAARKDLTVSVIVPARNEAGTIGQLFVRLPELGNKTELILIEGGSTDDTWDEILRQASLYGEKFQVRALKQTGKGKANAVRQAIEESTGELIIILDSDLSVAPEDLPRFVRLYQTGLADFINGSRLVYPMEGAAMPFLNSLANVFFAM